MVKKVIHKTHLLLGLTSGIIVFILAVTGCIYAFEREIQDASQEYRFVPPEEKPFIAPSELRTIAEEQVPGKAIHSVQYADRSRAAVITFYHWDPEYYYLVYINPYSGEVLKVKNMDEDFFRFILNGHFYLWLPPDIGQPVVAISTLVFAVMLITGIILWFPRNKAARKQRFSIAWKAKWRRKNFDLHSVLGFYSMLLALVFVITGLVFGFEWFAKSYYYTLSGGKELVMYYEPQSDTTATRVQKEMPLVDFVWQKTMAENPAAATIEVHYPETNASPIHAAANSDPKTYWQADNKYYDQYTLKEIEVTHQYGRYNADMSMADQLMRMNYDIHTGAAFGITGKIIAFLVSLIIATLPITGFLLWYGRKFRKSTSAAHQEAEVSEERPVKEAVL
jgi:uncharacterized iron-regulated membrane protein